MNEEKLNRPSVLVVEDDPDIGVMERMILECEGYAVTVVDDPGKALDHVAVRRPDAMILDYDLPGMSGLDLSRRLNGDPETKDIPRVLVSAATRFRDPGSRRELSEAGISRYLPKPFDAGRLVRTVAEMISGGQQSHNSGINLTGLNPDNSTGGMFFMSRVA